MSDCSVYPKPFRINRARSFACAIRASISGELVAYADIQELMGHRGVSMTQIDAHVLQLGGVAVRSPADALTSSMRDGLAPQALADREAGIPV